MIKFFFTEYTNKSYCALSVNVKRKFIISFIFYFKVAVAYVNAKNSKSNIKFSGDCDRYKSDFFSSCNCICACCVGA